MVTFHARRFRRFSDLGLVFECILHYPFPLAIGLAAMIVTSAATVGISYSFKQVIDRGFSTSDNQLVTTPFHYLLLTAGVLAVATGIRFYCVSWLGERVVAEIRLRVQTHLLSLTPRFFEDNNPSEIASRLTSDTALIDDVVGSTVSIALRNAFTGIGGFLYMFSLSPKLASILLFCIPVVVLPVTLAGRRIRDLSRIAQDRVADAGALATQTLSAIKTVKAFGQETREETRFRAAVHLTFTASMRRIALQAFMNAVAVLLIFGSVTFVVWQGTTDIADGRLSGGTTAAFILTAGFVANSFGALTEVYGDLLRGAGAAGRLAELLREKPEVARPELPVDLPRGASSALTFVGVRFHYPTRKDVAALDDFTLAIRPGERVAVVGPSGAGKSTLFQLAERFYDPASGCVMIDGIDFRKLDPAEIRERIAMVPQEPTIFAATARDNLRYGRWEATDDELWAAAEIANAADFLRALPQRLDTNLGESGAKLSGGERQRVTIARAILRDSPILLLDEATSALDAESEKLVQQAVEHLMQNRTTLVIAHRLATVRAAKRIIVMDAGKIVEQGTHECLIARAGLYARLASLQFREEM